MATPFRSQIAFEYCEMALRVERFAPGFDYLLVFLRGSSATVSTSCAILRPVIVMQSPCFTVVEQQLEHLWHTARRMKVRGDETSEG